MSFEIKAGTIEERLENGFIEDVESCSDVGCSRLRQIACVALFAATAPMIWMNPKCPVSKKLEVEGVMR